MSRRGKFAMDRTTSLCLLSETFSSFYLFLYGQWYSLSLFLSLSLSLSLALSLFFFFSRSLSLSLSFRSKNTKDPPPQSVLHNFFEQQIQVNGGYFFPALSCPFFVVAVFSVQVALIFEPKVFVFSSLLCFSH